MFKDQRIVVAKSGDEEIVLDARMANRHGMIAGATGTGKTVTLKVLAESFSAAGVPVFFADVKGDLAGTAFQGEDGGAAAERAAEMGLSEVFSFEKFPVNYWDVYGTGGIPFRTTISEMGPMLLSRILGLNATQSDILTVVFRIADDENLLLIDTKDLKAALSYAAAHAKEYAAQYGNIAANSVNAIVRSIAALEAEGADRFFGEPAVSIHDLISLDSSGKGIINILDCRKLILNPAMYSTFLLYIMSELFEDLPETGDSEKPKMVFFFDEAHMIFDQCPPVLLQKVEQVVKLIRSKGVGIYFVTQNPTDIPDGIMNQLGNKIQHALHAYTPKEIKAVKGAAETYRADPGFNTYETIISLATGEAVISLLDSDGVPGVAKKAKILPPQSRMGAISDAERDSVMRQSLLYSKYVNPIDNDSAYEFLQRMEMTQAAEAQKEEQDAANKKASSGARRAVKSVASTAAGTIGRELGNNLGKSVGGAFGKRLGGNVGAQLGRSILGTLFKV